METVLEIAQKEKTTAQQSLLGIGGAFSCFRDVLQQELDWSSTLQSKEKAANTEFTNLMKTT